MGRTQKAVVDTLEPEAVAPATAKTKKASASAASSSSSTPSEASPPPKRSGKSKGTTASGSRPATEKSGTSTWNQVRPEQIKRARQLLQDANYPSDEVIESVAELLERNWRRQREVTMRSGG